MEFLQMPTIAAIKLMTPEVRAAWLAIENRIVESRALNAAATLLSKADAKKLQ